MSSAAEDREPTWAGDLAVGRVYRLGSYRVSTEEIVEFAAQWDPQPFHVDQDVAARGPFGELIGSGLHSLAVLQRLTVLAVYDRWAVVAGRRMRDVQLTAPLRGGTVLTGTVEIEAVERRPGRARALVTTVGRLTGDGTPLLEAVFETYVRERP